jgi:hypothetical protein
MLKNIITALTEGKHGKAIHQFPPVQLSKGDKEKGKVSFTIREKGGQKRLVLELIVDEGHEIERESCLVDEDGFKQLERLISDVRDYNAALTSSSTVERG